jgi:hypothetical protein
MRSRARSGMLMLGLLTTMGCDPCGDLDAKICSDLGADCQVWNTDLAELRSSLLSENDRRMTSRWRTCSALADEPTYSRRILPTVQNAVARLRDPRAPQLPVETGAPSGGGGGGPWMLLPLLAVAGYVAYYKFVMPKQRAAAATRVSDLSDAQARAREELRAQQEQNKREDG